MQAHLLPFSLSNRAFFLNSNRHRGGSQHSHLYDRLMLDRGNLPSTRIKEVRAHGQPDGKDREVVSFFGWRATLGLPNRCFGVSELNFRDAMCCLGGSDQALQPDALGISLVSRPKRYEVGSLLVDMGNPN